jgi:hypothetical protein
VNRAYQDDGHEEDGGIMTVKRMVADETLRTEKMGMIVALNWVSISQRVALDSCHPQTVILRRVLTWVVPE